MENTILLKTYNIGGLLGEHEFSFSKNKLNILEGPNASGKTSIAKGLMAVLGIDNHVVRAPGNTIWSLEAINLGLVPERRGNRAGIVHADAEMARVILIEPPEVEMKIEIEKNSKITPDINANSNFLITGTLTPNSWIYRAISTPTEMRNESIFKYYITRLSSKAQRYEQVAMLLHEQYSELYRQLNEIKKRKAMIPNLKREINTLKREIGELQRKKENLINLIGVENIKKKNKIEQLTTQLKDLERQKRSVEQEIEELEKEIDKNYLELQRIIQELEELEDQKKEKKERLELINHELSKPLNVERLDNEIEELRNKRLKLQGQIELYHVAIENLEDTAYTICPLCGAGNVTREHLERELNRIKEEINKISDKLKEKYNERESLVSYREKLNKEREDILKSLPDIEDQIQLNNTQRKVIEDDLKNNQLFLKEKQKELDDIIEERNKINEMLRKENPEILKEIDKIEEEIAAKSKLLKKKESEYITSGYITVFGVSLELTTAQNLIMQMLRALENSKEYALKKAEEIRSKAINQFNTMIKEVLKRTKFSEFKRIYLDKNYILNVQYVSPEGEIKIIQPYALSESERVLVALVLMLAFNKVYRDNINYIVIDNMYEYFDEYRTEEVLKLLSEYAKKEHVTILLTKTTSDEETTSLRVRVVD
ncbi:MAG: AAA family ATPase [Actinobacteria bacterium]|nr:AAA family ATPase [Actinomycetota bacterium]